jgi:hypothetical protein
MLLTLLGPQATTQTELYLGVSGVWKKVTLYYGVSGVWKQVTLYYGVGGVWK